jgi:hypothetical protein
MTPFKIEQLPWNLREDVEVFLRAHPDTPAARLRPDIGGIRHLWLAFIGPVFCEEAMGIGKTPRRALEDFNRHFREPLHSRNGQEASVQELPT